MTVTGRWRVLVAALVVPLAGCGLLPTTGPVEQVPRADALATPPNADFVPPGPTKDDSAEQVVQGFLMAMTGLPLSTSVARRFLSASARDEWEPSAGTLAYETATPSFEPGRSEVRLTLTNVRQLDARGAWQRTAQTSRDLDLQMVQEDGQWRLNSPPNVVILPTWYLEDQYRAEQLWYFDRTGRTMISQRVYLPQTDDLATSLVRALVQGPVDDESGARSFLPAGAPPNLAVREQPDGVAEVWLGASLRSLPKDRLSRAVAQLTQTLSQLDDVRRIRLFAGESPLTLPGGERAALVDVPPAYDAVGIGTADLYGIRGGVVRTGPGVAERVSGTFGRPGLLLRSIAVRPGREPAGRPEGNGVAGVTQDGRKVLTGPPTGSAAGAAPRRVYRGRDLLRPAYDLLGGLWLVDRRGAGLGAQVVLVRGGRWESVRVPGISGRNVLAFVVSPDGGTLVALERSTGGARVVLSRLVRRPDGTVVSAGPVRELSRRTGPLADAIDLCWYGSQDLAVLSRSAASGSVASEVDFVSLDGSLGFQRLVPPDTWRSAATALVGSSVDGAPLYLLSGRRLLALDDAPPSRWRSSGIADGLLAPTFPG